MIATAKDIDFVKYTNCIFFKLYSQFMKNIRDVLTFKYIFTRIRDSEFVTTLLQLSIHFLEVLVNRNNVHCFEYEPNFNEMSDTVTLYGTD